MPADLNHVSLVGRLTRDPQLAHTAAGDPVANLRLAVTGRARDAAGAWVDRPNYFDVVVWGRRAETAGAHLGKGRRIGVAGRLAWREWEDPEGHRRQAVEVVASDLFFLDSPRERQAAEAEPVGVGAGSAPEGDDDIPF